MNSVVLLQTSPIVEYFTTRLERAFEYFGLRVTASRATTTSLSAHDFSGSLGLSLHLLVSISDDLFHGNISCISIAPFLSPLFDMIITILTVDRVSNF